MTNHLAWFKSSYSDGDGSACVEVALDTCSYGDGTIFHVRDSKLGEDGPAFAVPSSAWQAFLSQVS
ncbi:DUF397 domain-containing protein [Streptomyces sp. NPDC051109]|uniref:DUF397 domain-containing protein n=1 Tax=Streptomyces sp. NPDC051109 TaxID=3365642 RepID=UPI001065FBC4